jgi:magnesium transporter
MLTAIFQETKNMLYLSSLIGKTIKISSGEKLGKIADFVIPVGETFPSLTGVIILRGGQARKALWEQVSLIEDKALVSKVGWENLQAYQPNEKEILLKEDLLDKQIVDISGNRVVRVNDLHLSAVQEQLRVVGVDIGTAGLFRRLGMEKFYSFVSKAFHLPNPPNIIPWNYVETLNERNFSQIKLTVTHKKLQELHPADLAEILNDLQGAERVQLFHSLDTEVAAEVLQEMEEDAQLSLFKGLSDEQASHILEEMAPDEAADLLSELPKDKANVLLSLMEEEEAAEVQELLTHDEDSAGGIMTTEFISIPQYLSAQETIDFLREMAPDAETIYYLYVVDEEERLVGVLSLRDLIVAQPSLGISNFMRSHLIKVGVDSSLREVADLMSKYDLLALPVVDKDNHLKGIITFDDVIELLLPTSWRRRGASII